MQRFYDYSDLEQQKTMLFFVEDVKEKCSFAERFMHSKSIIRGDYTRSIQKAPSRVMHGYL